MVARVLTRLASGAILVVALSAALVSDSARAEECGCYECACEQAPEPTCPPRLSVRRFDESWRPCLCKCPCSEGGPAFPFKARTLVRRPPIWASLGGQVRARYEAFRGIGFGAPADADDAWLLLRGRTHVDLHVGEVARVFVEGIYAQQIDERELGPRPIDINEGDLLNAFLELRHGGLDVRVGRQELLWGEQRLLGPLDWANTRRTFEGVSARWAGEGRRLEAFVVEPVVVDPDAIDERDDQTTVWGVEYSDARCDCLRWAAYVLGVERDAGRAGDITGEERRITLGAWAKGRVAGTRLDFDVEAAYQLGELEDLDVGAWMASVELGWRPCGVCWSPRLSVGFDYASGDSDPADGELGTFDALYPTGHKFLGEVDVLGRSNLLAANVRLALAPTAKLGVTLTGHAFWRAETQDDAYAVTGRSLRAAGGSDERRIGYELDLKATYTLSPAWKVSVAYARFFTGPFLRDTGADDDLGLFYASATFTF